MKYVLIALVVLSTLHIAAQETNKHKASIGIFYSPNISYRNLVGDSHIIDSRDDLEIVKYGQSFGLGFRYQFSNWIGIETGLNIQNRGFKAKPVEFIPSEPDPIIPDEFQTIDRFYYLGIPLKLTLHKDLGKIAIVPSLGIVGNILLDKEFIIIITTDGETEKKGYKDKDDYRDFGLTSVVGIGIDYKLNQSIILSVTPILQYDLMSVIDAPIETYLWDFGLSIACMYHF